LLKFPEVKWETERQFYEWCTEVARACYRSSPTYQMFHNVLRFSVPPEYHDCLRVADMLCNKIDTDDYFVHIGDNLFLFDQEVTQT